MTRWMHDRRTVIATPQLVMDEIVDGLPTLLQQATGQPLSPPDGDGGVVIPLSGPTAGRLQKQVRVIVGEHRTSADGVAVPMRWTASPGAHLFPSFDGFLEVSRATDVSVDVVLIGEYTPPFGLLGAEIDAALLGGTAQKSAKWLLERIVTALNERLRAGDQPERPRQQYLNVADIMTRDPITFVEDQSLPGAAGVLLHRGISGAPVVDSQDRVVGVLSEADLLDKVATPARGLSSRDRSARFHKMGRTVGDVCTRPARTTQAEASVRDAAQEMARHDVDRLVVLDGAKHVGIVTRTDALNVLVRDETELEWTVWEELRRLDADDVVFGIYNGIITLRGEVPLRSGLRGLVSRIADLDGVIDVRSDSLGWQVDDADPAAEIRP